MHPDEIALQAAIDAAPLDTLPRLVFCDWLAEHNDPREEGYRILTHFDRWPWVVKRYYDESFYYTWVSRSVMCFNVEKNTWEINYGKRRHGLPHILITKMKLEVNSRREAYDNAALTYALLTPNAQDICVQQLKETVTWPLELKLL